MKKGVPSSKSGKRFLVAFSFAGEKREFVGQVATLLAKRFGEPTILYDKYHEAQFARSDLGIHLPDLYHKESDLVVLVICKDYEKKEWCGLEWTAIHALLKERRVEDVMLCRFDHALIKGLYSTAGFVELDQKSPEEAAKLIVTRLKSNGIKTTTRRRTPKPDHINTTTSAIPNNLPRLHSFFGRENELKTIADALSPKTRTWGALIDGPGGMGKTSLAIRAAELLPAEQFQRIFFLSSKARKLTSEGERSLSDFVVPGYLDMLNEMARQMGQPQLAKAPENERPRLLIDALGSIQALLILDNLESLTKDQQNRLFEFVSQLPPGCKAIATSRRRTDVDARIIRLAKLEQDAALAMITQLATDRPLLANASISERMHLYEETGGNPLLLRWVAGQLGKGRCRTVAGALAYLRSAPSDNDPLEFIFGDLLETFTDNEAKVLAALSYFTQQVEVKLVAELANVSKTAAETALGDLANRALVIPDEEERHFALVPMVADFLRRKRPELVAETGNRLEQRAFALIMENGQTRYDKFPILDAAWPTVGPVLPLFLSGPNMRLQTVCIALQNFLNFTGRWDERLSLSEQAESKAAAVGDHVAAGWRAYNVGWIHYLRRQAEAVLSCADRASNHWEKAKAGARERAYVIRLRGIGYGLKAEHTSAIAAYNEALQLLRTESIDSDDEANILSDMAGAELASGNLDAAEKNYREALRVIRAIGDAEGEANFTGNLSTVAINRGDWVVARRLGQKALKMSEKIGRQELIAANCQRIAVALLNEGKLGKAKSAAHRALEIYTKLNMSRDIERTRATLNACQRPAKKLQTSGDVPRKR